MKIKRSWPQGGQNKRNVATGPLRKGKEVGQEKTDGHGKEGGKARHWSDRSRAKVDRQGAND
jgi:hypothetical protein